MEHSVWDWIAGILLIVGGLNWGLIGLFNFNLVTTIFGAAIITKIIYVLVGISAIYMIFAMMKEK